MRRALRYLTQLAVALLLLAGCTSAESADEAAQAQTPTPVEVAAPTPTATATPRPTATSTPTPTPTVTPLANWCTELSPLIQEAAVDALLTLQPDPVRFETAFRILLVRLQQAEPEAPVEIALTMTSAREGLEDLIRLLERAGWERSLLDASQLDRVDGRFEGALDTIDTFTILECDRDYGILVPGNDGPVDWCEGRIIQVQVATVQALTLSSEGNSDQRETSLRNLLASLLESFDEVPDSLEVTMASIIDNLINHLDYLDELASDNEQRRILGTEMTAEELLFTEEDLRFEVSLMTADLLEALNSFDEYSVFSCGFESALDGIDTGVFDEELARLEIEAELNTPDTPLLPPTPTPGGGGPTPTPTTTPLPLPGAEQTPTPTPSVREFMSPVNFFGDLTDRGLTDGEANCLVDAFFPDGEPREVFDISVEFVAASLRECGFDNARIAEVFELGLD